MQKNRLTKAEEHAEHLELEPERAEAAHLYKLLLEVSESWEGEDDIYFTVRKFHILNHCRPNFTQAVLSSVPRKYSSNCVSSTRSVGNVSSEWSRGEIWPTEFKSPTTLLECIPSCVN